MKYLTAQQCYYIDKITTQKYLIPSLVLMENAGRSVAEFVEKICQRKAKRKITIFCGPGKNGGDGFVVSRYLFIHGYDICVVTFVSEEKYSSESLLNLKILQRLGIKPLLYPNNVQSVQKQIFHSDIIVDSIFGIGLNREIDGVYKEVIHKINNSRKIVVSVDIPSGIDANSGKVLGVAVKADYTVTMGFYKSGFRNPVAKKFCGKIVLCDIGYPKIPLMELKKVK